MYQSDSNFKPSVANEPNARPSTASSKCSGRANKNYMESNDLNSNSLNSEYGGNCIASHGSKRCLVSNNVQIYVDEGEAIKDAKASIESSLCHVLGPELRSNGRPVTCKELNVKLNAGTITLITAVGGR